ncbi:aldehyde dehydrogenase family protein [Lysinibacillus pakistanensis]|uniref:aldehyde dehydrogenase family protein n=1 Tax=Lysinibacillus pakistanensis TaxID=759811 RepID=UPI003D2A26D1
MLRKCLRGNTPVNVGGNINAFSAKSPLGVVATIAPFNFPCNGSTCYYKYGSCSRECRYFKAIGEGYRFQHCL